MENTTTRNTDQMVEKEVGKFLDQYFYGKSANPFERVSNKEDQLAGIDVKASGRNIDEKCKYHGLLNQILKYPSFEISFFNRRGEINKGWFINPESKTQIYAFIAVFLKNNIKRETSNITFQNIDHLNVLFVSKKSLKKLIQIDDSTLFAESLHLRTNPAKKKYFDGFHLTYSDRLFEKPVNLVIKRSYLKEHVECKEVNVYPDRISRVS